jgi:pimeloyl-ACP methyl ester carboxylesterase
MTGSWGLTLGSSLKGLLANSPRLYHSYSERLELRERTFYQILSNAYMKKLTRHFIETNGVRMHLAEQGEGPVVLLCHGFPKLWYSWRHQLKGLAAAGFHAVAPDMRGYGQTDRPEAIDQYTLLHLVGDMVGLLDAIDQETAVIAGHDWGAPVAWHAALLRPDRFRAVIGLSVPFIPRGQVYPSRSVPETEDAVFYQSYFQSPGVAEADFEHDVRLSVRSSLYSWSGDAPRAPIDAEGHVFMVPRKGGLMANQVNPAFPATHGLLKQMSTST